MTEHIQAQSAARVLLVSYGTSILRSVGHVSNPFMIDGGGNRRSPCVLQHLLEPCALAAPMRRHHDEDEYTYVLTGRIGAILGDEEVLSSVDRAT